MKKISFLFITIFISIVVTAQTGTNLFDTSYVHEIRIEFDTANYWNIMLMQYEYSNNNQYNGEPNFKNLQIPAMVSIDSNIAQNIGIRIKGEMTANFFTTEYKKSFKIDFNKYVDGQKYDGLKKINLNNSANDPTFMRDMLAYNLFNEAGIAAPRISYTRVYINNEYLGLYYIVEEIDKTFLTENFESNDGNLYKANQAAYLKYDRIGLDVYKTLMSLETNEVEDDWSRFEDFILCANRIDYSIRMATYPVYEKRIDSIFDLEQYYKVLAIDMITGNIDTYTYGSGRNFYIYDNPATAKFTWIPWDYDFSFNHGTTPLVTYYGEQSPLMANILKRPKFLQAFVDTYKQILDSNFISERLFPLIDRTESLVTESVILDTNNYFKYNLFKTNITENVIINDFGEPINYTNFTTVYTLDEVSLYSIDTTAVLRYKIDTLIHDIDTAIYIIIQDSVVTYYSYYEGLKPFINQKIIDAPIALANVIIPQEPNEIGALLNNTDIVIYPNPAEDFIILSGVDKTKDYTIRIKDIRGNQIIETTNNDIIYIENLDAGIYILELTQRGNSIIKRFHKN